MTFGRLSKLPNDFLDNAEYAARVVSLDKQLVMGVSSGYPAVTAHLTRAAMVVGQEP